MDRRLVVACVAFSALAAAVVTAGGRSRAGASGPSPKERLGRHLFFDADLSEPRGQSCAACHAPEVGWSGPDEASNRRAGVYPGAVKTRFGNRKAPASAYCGDSPVLHEDPAKGFVGGMFWDGRADGSTLGDPLAEQALGPPLNPLEQNMPDKAEVVRRVKASSYAKLFEEVWGAGSLDPETAADAGYEKIGRSIAAFERSAEVNPFRSRFDGFWRKARAAGLAVESIDAATAGRYRGLGLEDTELRGLLLFNTRAKCSGCHTLAGSGDRPPLFTDFGYDNIGAPRNPDNPFYAMDAKFNPKGKDWVDLGLGEHLGSTKAFADEARENLGKHKVPTLRNVDKRPRPGFVKAYLHNGYFRSLLDVVHFYNTRTAPDAGYPPPEVADNLNVKDMGALGLTADEEKAIVAFMATLTDPEPERRRGGG